MDSHCRPRVSEEWGGGCFMGPLTPIDAPLVCTQTELYFALLALWFGIAFVIIMFAVGIVGWDDPNGENSTQNYKNS